MFYVETVFIFSQKLLFREIKGIIIGPGLFVMDAEVSVLNKMGEFFMAVKMLNSC